MILSQPSYLRDNRPETLFIERYQSPLGTYLLISSPIGVVRVLPEDTADGHLVREQRYGINLQSGGEHNKTAADQLKAYFAGRLRQFTVPLDLRGTPFQRQVWEQLGYIPYGETRSYQQVSQALHRPKAARAVGQAIGSNPASIIVPCHRVIGASGHLTGYGGGLPRKRALLKLEANQRP